jgi:hypothetical protein
MAESPMNIVTDLTPTTMSVEDLNAELGTPAPQPLEDTSGMNAGVTLPATPPQQSRTPDLVTAIEDARNAADPNIVEPLQLRTQDRLLPQTRPLDDTFKFKGLGNRDVAIKSEHIDTLRANRNDPEAVDAFEIKYGKGTAGRYLSVPKKEHVETLVRGMRDPDAIEGFESIYGPGMARLYVQLYSPKSDAYDRYQAALKISAVLQGVTPAYRPPGYIEAIDSMATGVAKAFQELGQSVGIIKDDLVNEDNVVRYNPTTSAVIEGISQFVAGRAVVGGVIRAPKDLSTAYRFVREMGLGAIVDAFAFDPNDPLVGDAAKQIAQYLGKPEEDFSWLWKVNDFDSEWKKRAARATEGGAIGLAAESVLRLIHIGIKTTRLMRGNPIPEVNVPAGDYGTTPPPRVEIPQPELPGKPGDQLELPLGNMNDPNQAAQVRIDRMDARGAFDTPTPLTGDNFRGMTGGDAMAQSVEPRLPMDLSEDPAPFRPRGEAPIDSQEQALRDILGVDEQYQLDLRLGQPVGDGYQWSIFDQLVSEPYQRPRTALGATQKAADGQLDLLGTQVAKPKQAVPEPPISRTGSRTENIVDGLSPRTPEEKTIISLIDNVPPPAPNQLRALIDSIPDLTFTRTDTGQLIAGMTDTSFKAVTDAVAPVLKDIANIAKNDPQQLIRMMNASNTIEEVEKLSAVVNAATKRVSDDIAVINARLKALEQAGNRGSQIDMITRSELTPAINLKAQLDQIDKPLGTLAGSMLGRRAIERRLAAAVRVRVDELRGAGVTDRQIADMITAAIDNTKLDTKLFDKLVAQRDVALRQGDVRTVQKLDKKIARELDAIEKAANGEVDGYFNMAVKTVNDVVIPFMLSGLPTFITNVVAPVGLMAVRNLGTIVGTTIRKGPAYAFSIQQAKYLANKVGIQAQRKLLSEVMNSVVKEQSKVFSSDGFARQNVGYIKAESYGLNPDSAAGKAVNVTGKAIRALTWPLAFTDELAGTVAARAEVGAEAAHSFYMNVQNRLKALSDQFKDPTVPLTDKAALREQVKELQANPKIAVDGSEYTMEQWIEKRVKDSYSPDNVLIDPKIANTVEAAFGRDEFTSVVGRQFERAFDALPILRSVQPIMRIPVNMFVRGLEQIPGFQFVVRDPQSIYADLKGMNGEFRKMEAQGRVIIGAAITYLAYELAADGLITGEQPQNKWQRQNAMAANDVRGYNIKIGDKFYEYNAADPVAMPFKLAANFFQNVRTYSMRQDFAENQALYHFMAGVFSFAQAARDIPTAELLQTVGTFLQSSERVEGDPLYNTRAWEKLVTGFIRKLTPAFVRNVQQMNDPTIYDTAGGTIGEQIIKSFQVSLGMTDQVPRVYDILGEPLQRSRSSRVMFGMFAPLDPDSMDKKEFIRQSIVRIEQMTGRAFAMAPNPPGLEKIDLRGFQSRVGNPSVADTFFKTYNTIELGGVNVSDALYTLFKAAEFSPNAVGSYEVDGPLTKDIAQTIQRYRKAAWQITLDLEGPPTTKLGQEVKKIDDMKLKARNPANDPKIPEGLGGFATK